MSIDQLVIQFLSYSMNESDAMHYLSVSHTVRTISISASLNYRWSRKHGVRGNLINASSNSTTS